MIAYLAAPETTSELEDFPMPADPTSSGYHEPVLIKEVLEQLRPAPGMVILDGTLGGGGHTKAMAEAGATVVATDQDPEAIAAAGDTLRGYEGRVFIQRANFSEIERVLSGLAIEKLNGALLDLGVSSHQLDTPERGFSFQQEGPLDMRMGQSIKQTAAEVVNSMDAAELASIFHQYGEEPRARQIAAHLVRVRKTRPFETTLQLADAVCEIIPRRGPRHPATRVFQALRMHVNDELGALRRALLEIPSRLAPGAHFAVITFHSLEDRIVKVFFREHSREWIDRPEWPEPRRNQIGRAHV